MLRNMFAAAVLATGLLVFSATAVLADTVTFTGTTAGGPTWNRPVEGEPPTTLSGFGTNVPYSVTQLTVSTSGTYVFQSTATDPAAWDNYTFLYLNSFDPSSPLTNALIGNDDNPIVGVSGFSFSLDAGTTYFFVVTGFDNNESGAWSTEVSGQGVITVGPTTVPEPTTMLLFGSGVIGLVLKLRNRRQNR